MSKLFINYVIQENIMWLNVENIEEKEGTVIAELPDLPHLVGSGQSVGGVVSETVGATSVGEKSPLQVILASKSPVSSLKNQLIH